MAGFTDATEREHLDSELGTSRWIALSTTTPGDDGTNFTEPSDGYGRVEATSGDWNAASGSSPATKTNSSEIAFAEASGSWGTLTHWGWFDSETGGTPRGWGALDSSKTVASGDVARFAAGQLVAKMGDPGDSY